MSLLTLPGLIDIHVHLREPGQTQKEDFFTGTAAALAGGFTTVLDMPNNATPVTSQKVLEEKIRLAEQKVVCNIGFYFGSLADNFSEFGKVRTRVFGLKLFLNPTTGGYMVSEDSLPQIYDAWDGTQPILVHSEERVVEKVLAAVRESGKRTHFCHVASKFELSKIIEAKREGLPVTCGVTPHHLFLTEKDVSSLGSFAMMKPPLKSQGDVDFFWNNLPAIDTIESDHAPHALEEKNSESPPFGVPGLETTLPLLLMAESEERITLDQIIEKLFSNPRKIFNVPTDSKTEIKVDRSKQYVIRNKDLHTKCKWTPFEGRKVNARVVSVTISGKEVFRNGEVLAAPGSGQVIVPAGREEYVATTPAYDIHKSWEDNYKNGPIFTGSIPPKPVARKWKFLGHDLISPLGVAAGPLPNYAWISLYGKLGFGSLVHKTVRSTAHKSHPVPNVLYVDVGKKLEISESPVVGHSQMNGEISNLSITNSFGNPCVEPKEWMKEVGQEVSEIRDGQLLLVSVYGTMEEGMTLQDLADDYAKAALMAKKAGAPVIELNLSCPNVLGDEDPDIYKSPNATSAIVRTVKEKVGNTPIVLKVGYYDSYERLIEVLEGIKGYFEAVSSINTISKKVVTPDGKQALPGRVVSGVCGAAIREYGLETVRNFAKAREELSLSFEIIGTGGVMKAADVYDYLGAGANHVHCATAAMWNPYLAYEFWQLDFREKKYLFT